MDTANWIWSLVLAAIGILGLWVAGRRNAWGWLIGLAAQLLWVAYAFVTFQYGFLLSAVAYGVVYGRNFWRWYAERQPEPEVQPEMTRLEDIQEALADREPTARHWNGQIHRGTPPRRH